MRRSLSPSGLGRVCKVRICLLRQADKHSARKGKHATTPTTAAWEPTPIGSVGNASAIISSAGPIDRSGGVARRVLALVRPRASPSGVPGPSSGRRRRTAGGATQRLIGSVRSGIARLIDAYREGFLDKRNSSPGSVLRRNGWRSWKLETKAAVDRGVGSPDVRTAIGQLESFGSRVPRT